MKTDRLVKLVDFNPTKKRKVVASNLVKKIAKLEYNKALTGQDAFAKQVYNRVMLRLYHIAHGTSNMYSFPIVVEYITDNDGIMTGYKKDRWKLYNVKLVFDAMTEKLVKDGFNATVEMKPYRDYAGKRYSKTEKKCVLTVHHISDEFRNRNKAGFLRETQKDKTTK